VGARITEGRAANAARQLLYHRKRLGWMEGRMCENAALLESYLGLTRRGSPQLRRTSHRGQPV
jgi:hypothetical protein